MHFAVCDRGLTCTVHLIHIMSMKLSDYMKMKGMTDAEMGAKIGKERSLVSRYRRGEALPALETIAEIESVTDRAVSFRDFLPEESAA